MEKINRGTVRTIKKEWLEALRSGEYKKGHHALCTEKGFCCLGVLCDIYSKKTGYPWEVETTTSNGEPSQFFKKMRGEAGVLPYMVAEWAGLNPMYRAVKVKGKTLVELNDSEKYTFGQIADVIEKEL